MGVGYVSNQGILFLKSVLIIDTTKENREGKYSDCFIELVLFKSYKSCDFSIHLFLDFYSCSVYSFSIFLYPIRYGFKFSFVSQFSLFFLFFAVSDRCVSLIYPPVRFGFNP